MGVLTVTMTGLRDAIVSSRQVRMALRGDLVRQTGERRMRVSALCAGFASDRAGAHRAWFGPAKAPADEQPPATPNAEPRADMPVAAPAAPPSRGPLPRAKKRSVKGLKKH
jgi:hypothetical protein